MTPYKLSVDGIELQACNGVGHYALTMSLLPILKSTAAQTDSHVRIVNVSSDGQDLSAKKLDFASLEGINAKDASPLERYGNSKLMNVLFTDKLQEELEGTGIRCISIHPGAVRTELTRGPWSRCSFARIYHTKIGVHMQVPQKAGHGCVRLLYVQSF